MCNAASFIITLDRVFWSHRTNSHSAIIEEFFLHEQGVRGPNVVPAEIVPRDGDYSTDPATWKYQTECDSLPEWYDAVRDEARCRAELTAWHRYHCCPCGTGAANETVTCGDMTVTSSGDRASQKAGYCASQTAGNRASQKAGYRASQTAGDDSSQTAVDDSTQTAGDDSSQSAGNRASQKAGYRATQTAGDDSSQSAGYRASQTAGNDSSQTAGYDSSQKAGYHSSQKAGDGSSQKAGDGTVQITRWHDGEWRVAVRIVTSVEADRWWFVQRGAWRECTAEESAAAEQRVGMEDRP